MVFRPVRQSAIRGTGKCVGSIAGIVRCLAVAGIWLGLAATGCQGTSSSPSHDDPQGLKVIASTAEGALAEADLRGAAETIAEFVAARNATYRVPLESVATVEAEQVKIKDSCTVALQGIDDPRPAILPGDVRSMKTVAWEEAVRRLCTERYATALIAENPIAWLDLSLYNSPNQPPYVDTPSAILSVSQAGVKDGLYVLWVLGWGAAIRAGSNAPEVEDWSVREYVLSRDAGVWHIDEIRLLLVCVDDDTDNWGPIRGTTT